ncbi:hypothetical protein IF2G_00614 [Cordyceps javanica]|nr:hypothetical protein IF2G_00614 [Cordyceps javanica]
MKAKQSCLDGVKKGSRTCSPHSPPLPFFFLVLRRITAALAAVFQHAPYCTQECSYVGLCFKSTLARHACASSTLIIRTEQIFCRQAFSSTPPPTPPVPMPMPWLSCFTVSDFLRGSLRQPTHSEPFWVLFLDPKLPPDQEKSN